MNVRQEGLSRFEGLVMHEESVFKIEMNLILEK